MHGLDILNTRKLENREKERALGGGPREWTEAMAGANKEGWAEV